MDFPKNINPYDAIITILFVIYIIFNIQMPTSICSTLDNVPGNIAISLIALFILYKSHPVVGILALLAAFQFISRCRFSNSPLHNVSKMIQGSKKYVSPWKDIPITLEEEMVKEMAPLVVNNEGPNLNYTPISSDQHGASFIGDA